MSSALKWSSAVRVVVANRAIAMVKLLMVIANIIANHRKPIALNSRCKSIRLNTQVWNRLPNVMLSHKMAAWSVVYFLAGMRV